MKYYSLNHNAPKVSFQEAVIQGLAADKGLYFPESITPLPQSFFDNIDNLSHEEIAFEAIQQFVGDEIPTETLKQIIAETLCFDFPVVPIENDAAWAGAPVAPEPFRPVLRGVLLTGRTPTHMSRDLRGRVRDTARAEVEPLVVLWNQ